VSPAGFLKAFMAFWLASLGLLLGYRLLTGQINLAGVLAVKGHTAVKGDPTVKGHTFSPSRLQLLVATVSALAAYVTASLSAHEMVAVQNDWVALFALSHAAYIGPKAYRVFTSNSKS
jgi:hypothetical protein